MEIDRRRVRRLIEKSRTQERALNRVIRRQAWLDPLADAVQKAVGAFYGALGAPGRSIKNVMHGTAVLGHPLHPALTDVPIGAWTVGVIADWLFVATGRVPALAGDLALAVGVAGAILAAVTGYTDFHETEGHERRTAIVQGLTMSLGCGWARRARVSRRSPCRQALGCSRLGALMWGDISRSGWGARSTTTRFRSRGRRSS